MPVSFQFGLSRAVPEDKTTAWGARWIFPDDILWDRQSFPGLDSPAGARLQSWLDSGAIAKARAAASNHRNLSPDNAETVTLFEDEVGIVVANPQRSYGYLYVAAWLKDEPAALDLGALVTWSDGELQPTWFTGHISAIFEDGQIEVEPVREDGDDFDAPPIMLDAASVKLVAQTEKEQG